MLLVHFGSGAEDSEKMAQLQKGKMGSQKQVQLLEKGEENLLKEQQELGEKIEKTGKIPASTPVSGGGRTPTERLLEGSGLSHMLASNPSVVRRH